MSITSANVAAAYSNQVQAVLPKAPNFLDEQHNLREPSFTTLVENAVSNAIDTGRNAEHKTHAALMGKAELADVVTSVASAEVTLQSVMAIRDKVVHAYQEILRMPI